LKKVVRRNFQSSVDEKKNKMARVESPSPEPHYMKEEVQLIKFEESRKEESKRESMEMIFTPKQRELANTGS